MSIYEFQVKTNNGRQTDLSEFRGKVLLIVNTASGCGFTPQYEGLQSLYGRYADRGLEILAFPCNQFLGQEPGTDGEIRSFCSLTYGVSFPLFAKIEVRGENAHPLYRYLTQAAPFAGYETDKESGRLIKRVVGEKYPEFLTDDSVKWNFTKFLVDREGNVVGRFEPSVTPEELEPVVEKLL